MRRLLAALAPAYLPRRPTQTVLYGLVRQHLSGTLTSGANLDVDLLGVPAKDGIDALVYKVHLSVTPSVPQFQLSAATSASSPRTSVPWGVFLTKRQP